MARYSNAPVERFGHGVLEHTLIPPGHDGGLDVES